MKNKSVLSIEELESRLPGWEKWLFFILGATLIMLIQGFIKHYENTLLSDMMFALTNEQGVEAGKSSHRVATGGVLSISPLGGFCSGWPWN